MSDIKAGDYIHQVKTIPKEYFIQREIEDIYSLVLKVSDNIIEAYTMSGTPLSDKTVHEYANLISAGYNVKFVSSANVSIENVYTYTIENNLPRGTISAQKYKWNDNELLLPLSQIYWNGREWTSI